MLISIKKAVKKISFVWVILAIGFFALSASADLASQCAKLFTSADFDEFAKSVSAQWKDIEEDYKWRVWVDSPAEYKRFVNTPDFVEAGENLVHPTEIYDNGLAQYRSMKEADKFLNSIPKGQLRLSVDLFRQAHKVVMKDVYTLPEKILYKLGGGLFGIAGPGKLKRTINFGLTPLYDIPLTDAQVELIRSDGINKFWSFFRRGPDKNYGLIVFPSSPEKSLEKLIEWYETNKTVLSPIQLAAGFQRRFIQIHPFDNGNGRLSRLFMDRILAENDLPPALLRNHDLDIYVTEEQWAQEVAAGVAEFQSVAHQALRDSKKTKMANTAPFVGDYDHGAWINAKDFPDEKLNTELFPEKSKAKISAKNGETYVLYRDGFFYSDRGIPHVYQDGSLYPIADQNYLLYGLGGAIDEASPAVKGSYRRTLTPQMEAVYRGNMEAVDRIANGSLNPAAIEVKPYSVVSEANKKGSYSFHPWERKWLRRTLEIREKSPAAILAANRGGFTEFEKAFNNGENVRISSILAQYQAVDLNYARLEYHFRKIEADPDLVSTIEASRKKLWQAVRHYINRYESESEQLVAKALPEIGDSGQRLALMRQLPQTKLFYEYLSYTRAGYSTWEEATRQVAWDEIYLLRNDFKAIRWLGFLSEGQFAKIVQGIPGAEAFRNYVRKRMAATKELAKEAALDPNANKFAGLYEAMEKRIFVNPYISRGVDEEFQREYVDLYLHAVDRGQKSGVSFTTRTDQMVQNDGRLAFAGVADTKFQTYIVRMPVSQSVNNYASGWFRQYEVVAKKGYSNPFRTVKTFGPDEYLPKADPKLLQKLDAVLKEKQLIRIE